MQRDDVREGNAAVGHDAPVATSQNPETPSPSLPTVTEKKKWTVTDIRDCLPHGSTQWLTNSDLTGLRDSINADLEEKDANPESVNPVLQNQLAARRYNHDDMLNAWVAGRAHLLTYGENPQGDAPDFATWIRLYVPSVGAATDSENAARASFPNPSTVPDIKEEEWTASDVQRLRHFPRSHPAYFDDNLAQAHNASLRRVLGEPGAELAATVPTQNALNLEAGLRQIAAPIARTIFERGDGPTPCQRIQFMGGVYPDHERPQGGLCEVALVNVITEALSVKRNDAEEACIGKEHDAPRQLPKSLSSPSSANAQGMEGEEKDARVCYNCGVRADQHPWIPDGGGRKRGPCPVNPIHEFALPSLIKEQTAEEEEDRNLGKP